MGISYNGKTIYLYVKSRAVKNQPVPGCLCPYPSPSSSPPLPGLCPTCPPILPTPAPAPAIPFLVCPLHVLPFWAGLTSTSITFIHPQWAQINGSMQIQVAGLLQECKSQLFCHACGIPLDYFTKEVNSLASGWCSILPWSIMDDINHADHYSNVRMTVMVSQITGVSIVCSVVCSSTDQRKHQSSASLAFVRGIHWWPVDSPHKGPVMWKMLPFEDVIM